MAERTITGPGSVVGNAAMAISRSCRSTKASSTSMASLFCLPAARCKPRLARAKSLCTAASLAISIGEQSVHLEPGSRVVGDIRSPSISMAEGALLRGRLETEAVPSRDALPQLSRQDLGSISPAPVAERRPAIIKPTPVSVPKPPTAATPIGAVAVVRAATPAPAPVARPAAPAALTTPERTPVPQTTRAAQGEVSRQVARRSCSVWKGKAHNVRRLVAKPSCR
ncbi:MAG: polymer-forming cytoskeletal protein [Polyangiaceae bacterium]